MAARLYGTLLLRARSRGCRRLILLVSLVSALVLGGLAVKHFVDGSWPLAGGSPALLAGAGLFFLLGYALKALGWRRLFAPGERPHSLALAAASGGAAVAGIALPGRFDEVIRIAIVRRYKACPANLRTLCLSLVILALIDSAALVPLAMVGAALSGHSLGLQSGLATVAAVGVVAAVVVIALPRLLGLERLEHFRLSRWLRARATPWRPAVEAWALVSASWAARAIGLFFLLAGLHLGMSFPRAIVVLCAGAAAAVLPIGPAGAATQVGAAAAILVASGVGASRALDVAVSAQTLVILAGAVVLVAAVVWRAGTAWVGSLALRAP